MPHVSPQPSRPVRVLFVCLGNICRSPSAEGLFRHYVASQGAEGDYEIDSAGLIAHHEGELPDGRMRAHAARRGYSLESRSRPITYEDFLPVSAAGIFQSNLGAEARAAAWLD